MDRHDVIILLSRQRSGTNALRSVLESHPDIFCLNEVFNLADKDSENPILRETNFFTFLKKYARDGIERIFPDNHDNLFLDYLEYLRCYTSKRYMVIDVKLNTTHFLYKPTRDVLAPPYLYRLIVSKGLRCFMFTRKNYLRYVVSLLKAQKTGEYSRSSMDNSRGDAEINIPAEFMLHEIRKCHDEDRQAFNFFSGYSYFLRSDYAEAFTKSGISTKFLDMFSSWLSIDSLFEQESYFKKQSSLPLQDTIKNYDEVAHALRGTPFEYCLQDEKMYI